MFNVNEVLSKVKDIRMSSKDLSEFVGSRCGRQGTKIFVCAEKETQDTVSRTLNRVHYSTMKAEPREVFLETLVNADVGLVIMDLTDVCERAVRKVKRLKDKLSADVIVMTGMALDSPVIKNLTDNNICVLPKNVSPSQLLREVAIHLGPPDHLVEIPA